MGRHREKLIERYMAFTNNQRTTGRKTLLERGHTLQAPRLRAAFHLNRNELKSALKDEVDLKRRVQPVMETDVVVPELCTAAWT